MNIHMLYYRFARIQSERLQKSVVRITGKTTGLLSSVAKGVEGNKKGAEGNKKGAEGNKKGAEGNKKGAEGNKKGAAESNKKPRGKRSRAD